MADIKLQGLEDVRKLMCKEATWKPPGTLKEFLSMVEAVIATSKYTDSFLNSDDALENLRTFVKVKANRVALHPDIEECVDVAAYAYMVFHLFLRNAGYKSAVSRDGEG